jgi:hypothetical protein
MSKGTLLHFQAPSAASAEDEFKIAKKAICELIEKLDVDILLGIFPSNNPLPITREMSQNFEQDIKNTLLNEIEYSLESFHSTFNKTFLKSAPDKNQPMDKITYAYVAKRETCASSTQVDMYQLLFLADQLGVNSVIKQEPDSFDAVLEEAQNIMNWAFACSLQFVNRASWDYVRYGSLALLAGKTVDESAAFAHRKLRPLPPGDKRLTHGHIDLTDPNFLTVPPHIKNELDHLKL